MSADGRSTAAASHATGALRNAPPYLSLSKVVKRFGAQTVIDGLDFEVKAGEFVSLLGPSGCGKTTLLRMIAGLAKSDGGRITVDGADLTALPAHKRNIGVVFQSYALFPHLTVAQNIAFGLKAHGVASGEIGPRVQQALASVQLAALADRSISALSGGQQQRVAVARAIATKPRLILLDEPLSALDRKLRETMQIELRRMLREANITAIFVTHDQEEALVMSDRIAVMNRGRIEQFDLPETVYARPATPFTMDFVGMSSRIAGKVVLASSGAVIVETAHGRLSATGDFRVGDSVLLGVRPERIVVGPLPGEAGAQPLNRLQLTASETIYLGSRRMVYFDLPAGLAANEEAGPRMVAELPSQAAFAPLPGEPATLSWPVADTMAFAA
jgi:putative spermidine/putrescine transport system ATP-binding protein